jgi:glycine cleavage system aminomethyltransferase T
LDAAPERGAKLAFQGKDAGYLTSAVFSPALGRWIGLGYVRREADHEGGTVELTTVGGPVQARVVHPPFVKK